MAITPQDVFEYHKAGRPGKIEVVPTKPLQTQRDLSLAYTPGVAEAVLAAIGLAAFGIVAVLFVGRNGRRVRTGGRRRSVEER